MHRTHRPTLLMTALIGPLGLLLAGCAGGTVQVAGTAAPAGVGASSSPIVGTPTASPTGPVAGTPTASPTSARGCPAGGPGIPAGAGTARTVDLDSDGRADTLWLADQGTRRTLGVRTASGAGVTTTFSSAAPIAAVAVANSVAGGTVILLDTGRAVPLYAFTNCRIVPSLNQQGSQYSFDKGFTGYGTGVGCPVIGTSRQLVGYLATPDGTNTSTVTRTSIVLTGNGTRARNGSTVTLGQHLPDSSATVQAAHQVSCGPLAGAHEPQ